MPATLEMPLKGTVTSSPSLDVPVTDVIAPSLQEIVQHPDFEALTPVQQKMALGQLYPDFNGLTAPQQDLTLKSLRTGIAFKPPETKQTGELVPEDQPFSALAMGAGQGATAGLEGALFNRFGGTDTGKPTSPEFTNPYLFASGEITGSILPFLNPGAQAVKGTKALARGITPAIIEALKGVGQASLISGGFGAVSGASEKLANPETGAAEITRGGVEGGIRGALNPIALAGGGILRPLAGARAREVGLRGTLPPKKGLPVRYDPKAMPEQQRLLINVTDFSDANKGATESLLTGKFNPILNGMRPYFRQGSGGSGAITAADKLMYDLKSQIDPAIKYSDPSVFPTPAQIYAEADAILAKEKPNLKDRKRLLDPYKDHFDNMKADNITDYARDYNNELGAHYRKESQLTSESQIALEAVRDATSRAIHHILEAQGLTDISQKYSQLGLVWELRDQLNGQLRALSKEKAASSAEPILGKAIRAVVVPIGGKAYKARKIGDIVGQKYGPGDLGVFNDRVNRIFELGEIPESAIPTPRAPRQTPYGSSIP